MIRQSAGALLLLFALHYRRCLRPFASGANAPEQIPFSNGARCGQHDRRCPRAL
jgi:hypothetical protein